MSRMSRRRWIRRGLIIGLLIGLSLSSLGTISMSQWGSVSDETLQNLQEHANAVIAKTSEALNFVLLAWQALNLSDDIEGSIANVRRAINILEGPNGDHYDDSYGDSDSSTGALEHAQQMRDIIDDMSQGTDYKMTAENVDLFLQWAAGNLVKALKAVEDDAEAAARHVRQAQAMLIAALGSREEVDQPTQGSARAILEWVESIE
ncbi:MAG: hypothetical protein ABEK03_00460 [Candidatus Bipolaricaulia bacterium]